MASSFPSSTQDSLIAALRERAVTRGCAVREVTTESSDTYFTVRAELVYPDGLSVMVGVSFGVNLKLDEVEDEMITKLCGEIDAATDAWTERRTVIETNKRGVRPEPPDELSVYGFRHWKYREAENDLMPFGYTNGGPWQGVGWQRAQCAVGRSSLRHGLEIPTHHAPGPSPCHCGYNARFDLDQLDHGNATLPTVTGIMLGKGKLKVHVDGFRSEWARPLALTALAREEEEAVRAVAKRLGLSFVDRADALSFAAEFARPVPEEAKPTP